MNDWRSRLRHADPDREAALPEADLQRIRCAVLAAAHRAESTRRARWPRAFVVVATALVMLCASALAALQRTVATKGPAMVEAQPASDISSGQPEAISRGERQQLHFETPGGTRIIWVFDSEFEPMGSLP